MRLTMANAELELGGPYLDRMREATSLLGSPAGLQQQLGEEGDLLLRGLQSPERVRAARRALLEDLAANGQIDLNHPLDEAVVKAGATGRFLGGSKTHTRSRVFLDVVESPEIMEFFADLLQGPVLTLDYKWLRVVGPGDFTGAHFDVVYMGRGTRSLFTCWTPIGDVPFELGPLAVLAGSHRIEKLKQTYGEMDVDRDNVAGWFSTDPVEMVDRYGGPWLTEEFQAGDVLVFGMYTMHGSLTNVSNRYRLSADTRYQRADEPVDERWMGPNPPAHYAWMKGTPVPMSEMRKRWGV